MIRLIDLLKEVLLKESDIQSIVNEYIEWSKYDILNSWGSCAFYTKDFLEFCKATGKSCDVVYMPLGGKALQDIIDKFGVDENGDPKGEVEDHIIPRYSGQLIDFAFVPDKGVSHHDRKAAGTPGGKIKSNWPLISKYSDSLFSENGVYGKLGYVKQSKYSPWVLKEYPKLANGEYPIIMNGIPDYSTPEYPAKKQLKESC